MSSSEVTKEGLRGVRPGRDAMTGVATGKRGRRSARRDGAPTVPPAEFTSYYGLPILNKPVWKSRDIASYLFLGGLAGASSLLAAGGQATGRPALARVGKVGAFAGGLLSLAGLVQDLGKPSRFLHMLRVFKVTSPMSVGSWLLSGFVPASGVAAISSLTGRAPRIGLAATAASALMGPAVAAYTATLISDTAIPAWHDGYPEMPFIFAGSAATAAGGLGLLAAPLTQNGPARAMAVLGVGMELSSAQVMEHRIGLTGEPYSQGRAGRYMRLGQLLSLTGVAGALLGRRSRVASALSGAALMGASAATRWGIFHAGIQSANDPKYTVVPQRARLTAAEGS